MRDHRQRRVRKLEDGFGFGPAPFRATFAGIERVVNPAPQVVILGPFIASVVPHSQLRDLDQTRLNGVGEPKIADQPGKRPTGIAPHATQEVRGCRQIYAEIDTPQRVDAIEPFNPHRRFF